jgi:hypothetical protein
MRRPTLSITLSASVAFALFALTGVAAQGGASGTEQAPAAPETFRLAGYDRLEEDVDALTSYRPAYPFWRHLFTIPDGSIAFGSATTGRLLVTFPSRGDWARDAIWEEISLAPLLSGVRLPADLDSRREEVARRLSEVVGPVISNPTRGLFLLPNSRRYGAFLTEWAAIYERFGVPAHIGLAQAIVESGLSGTVRSKARAIGFCQWLQRNWNHLKKLAPHVIEAHNQTTQAPYCAAYLTILAAKYGSFIPALSEHHAGGTNVGRVLINGERLGGEDIREQYFMGGLFARDLRVISPGTFKDLYGTYGPRSTLYAEMVFANTENVARIMSSTPQQQVFGMRTARALSLTEIVRASGVSADEIRRFNPAIVRQVPARSTVFLPRHVPSLGTDVSFWHRPASAAYAEALHDFMTLDAPLEQWDSPEFDAVLQNFRSRFEATRTEEGSVMATMLTFVLQGQRTSRQGAILAEFRSSERIRLLFGRGRSERESYLTKSEIALVAE